MGHQLIFVVETNKKNGSDWVYIKETINHFYRYDQSQLKLTTVYMDGKAKYKRKEREIQNFQKMYNSSSKKTTTVIFCFDCDDYDSKQEDCVFLDEALDYCKRNGYEFIWFCKDIEDVYYGHQVEHSKKKEFAARFKANGLIENVKPDKLNCLKYHIHSGNILSVLDRIDGLRKAY